VGNEHRIKEIVTELERFRGADFETVYTMRQEAESVALLIYDALVPQKWNCPKDCQYLIPSGGSGNNPEIGGCAIEEKLPEGQTLEPDSSLPTCPFYKHLVPQGDDEGLLTEAELTKLEIDFNRNVYGVIDFSKLIAKAQRDLDMRLKDAGIANFISDYHCRECDTPGFVHLVIPIKVANKYLKGEDDGK